MYLTQMTKKIHLINIIFSDIVFGTYTCEGVQHLKNILDDARYRIENFIN